MTDWTHGGGAPAARGLSRDPSPGATSASNGPDMAGYVGQGDGGLANLHLLIEGVHCGGCIRRIEESLNALEDVEQARLNFTTRRLTVTWTGSPERARDYVALLERLGYRAFPFDPEQLAGGDRREERLLLRSLAVAGFAASNVMLLSVAVWAGAFEDMGPATRDLLHWFSAMVALPAIVYAGQPFFKAASKALRGGRLSMEVPISLAVILAAGMSLFETARGGDHAYFDSAVTLLFFLLIGRYLDRRARGQARSAAERLLALQTLGVTVLDRAGRGSVLPPDRVPHGATVLVAAGERVAVDGIVLDGSSEVDASIITGETLPAPVQPGDKVFAGSINQSAALRVKASAAGEGTLLSEIVRLMELAEQRKGRFVGMADRVARLYAPLVHLAALFTWIGWLAFGALDWRVALLHAIAVLIVTCPCALGLAIPAVQVIASGRLMRRGILLKSATALERLATVDTVVFDKTGTLTLGQPRWIADPAIDEASLRLAVGLAGASRHPLAKALAGERPDEPVRKGVHEEPGQGLGLQVEGGEVRLGSRAWIGLEDDRRGRESELWLTRPNAAPLRFRFEDRLRDDARDTIRTLKEKGYQVALLSGDREPAVEAVADSLGIARWRAAIGPEEKCRLLDILSSQGKSVLMVGDGLNDAPALAAAHVSLSPSSAADISQTAADAVFQGALLAPVAEALRISKAADRLIKQNFGLAFTYNVVAVPLAVAGLVSPLVAAVCMSASSLAVVGNSLRLSRRKSA